MFTRRTLLKGSGYAVFATALPTLIQTARAQAAGFDFFISPSGSDSNPGTLSSPWSITAINSKRSTYAGKRVGLLSGTYNVYALCQAAAWNAPALAVAAGTSGSPTYIAPCAPNGVYAPRTAILTAANPSGGGYPSTEAGIIGQGANSGLPSTGNVIIDGLYITRSFNYAIVFFLAGTGGTGQNGNNQGGATGIEVRNCEVFDIGGNDNDNVAGIYFNYCTGAWAHNNKIHSIQPPSNGQNPIDVAGIYSYYCTGNIYEYNTIYDCNQAIRDKYTPNGNQIYRYNYLEINGSSPQVAIQDGAGGLPGQTSQCYNNIINCPRGGGWNANMVGSGISAASLVFYNNTVIFGAGNAGLFWPGGGIGSAKVSHYNNVYSLSGGGNPGYQGGLAVVSGAIALSDYNLYGANAASSAWLTVAPASAPGVPSNTFKLSSWQNALGLDTHSAAVNPSFLSPTSLNPAGFALAPGQPGSVSSSIFGRVGGVAGGNPCDMGAWGGASPPTQIGCNFGPVPDPPVIISVS